MKEVSNSIDVTDVSSTTNSKEILTIAMSYG